MKFANAIYFLVSGNTRTMDSKEWVIEITKLFDFLDVHDDKDCLRHVVHCLV